MGKKRRKVAYEQMLAYHEAAHIVLMWGLGSRVKEVRMVASPRYDAMVISNSRGFGEEARTLHQSRLLGLKLMCEILAGPMAEVALGFPIEQVTSEHPDSDFQKSLRIAQLILRGHDAARVAAKASRHVFDHMLPPIWDGITSLAAELKPGTKLTGAALERRRVEVMQIVDIEKLPQNWTHWQKIWRKVKS